MVGSIQPSRNTVSAIIAHYKNELALFDKTLMHFRLCGIIRSFNKPHQDVVALINLLDECARTKTLKSKVGTQNVVDNRLTIDGFVTIRALITSIPGYIYKSTSNHKQIPILQLINAILSDINTFLTNIHELRLINLGNEKQKHFDKAKTKTLEEIKNIQLHLSKKITELTSNDKTDLRIKKSDFSNRIRA